MANAVRVKELNCIQKRDLLASEKASREEIRAYAQHYLDNGAYHDAVAFFQKAGDGGGLEACRKAAIEDADHELVWRLAHSDLVKVSEEDWRQCAARAIELGKLRVAAYIFNRLGDRAAFAQLPEELRPKDEGESE